jgi:hypothetical protein
MKGSMQLYDVRSVKLGERQRVRPEDRPMYDVIDIEITFKDGSTLEIASYSSDNTALNVDS